MSFAWNGAVKRSVSDVSTKKKLNVTEERRGLVDATESVVRIPEANRLTPKSGLSSAVAGAVGMGLAVQSSLANKLWASTSDDTPIDPNVDPVDVHNLAEVGEQSDAVGLDAAELPVDGTIAPVGVDVAAPADDVDSTASAAPAAAGRTSSVANATATSEAVDKVLNLEEESHSADFSSTDVHVPQSDIDPFSDKETASRLDPAPGAEGVVDGVIDALFGDDGVLTDLLGEDGLVDDLVDALVGEGGILDLSILDGLVGDDGLLDGVVDIILSDEGFVSEFLGGIDSLLDPVIDGVLDPIVDDVLEPVIDGVLDPIVDDVLEPVIDGVLDPVVGDALDPILGDLLGSVIGDVTGPILDDVIEPVLGTDVIGDLPIVGGLLGGAENADGSNFGESEDDGYLDTLLGIDDSAGAENVSDLTDVPSGDTLGDVLTGLLGDDDTFGVDVEPTETGDFGDLFAGLEGEGSLTGSLMDHGLLNETVDVLADGEVDSLLSEILGPNSSDVLAGGDAIDALLGASEGDNDLGAELTDGLVDSADDQLNDVSDVTEATSNLLDGLFFTQDD